MLFNSHEFLFLFLPITLSLYYLGIALERPHWSRLMLLCGSLFFYAYWDVRYLPLLVVSILCNYILGNQILSSGTESLRKRWLVVGIGLNLSALFFFKYTAFALTTILQISIPAITLPLGISFFTFTQIAFLVDAYSRRVEVLTPTSYGLFVTVFPHLIAGPILHHREMMQQFNSNSTYRYNDENMAQGLFLFTIGLAKKVLLADTLAPHVAKVFDIPDISPTLLDAWGAAVAYTLQLYFDFSGYSDMAVGLGLLFNIRLPINFDSPYKADSIIDFWRRWHMTLSTFLRDYLYIPLGGSRKGELFKMLNLFLTMLLAGLWHGAGWTFVLWGALQGVYLVINHLVRARMTLPTALAWPMTLLAVIVGWVIFRSADVTTAWSLLKGMGGVNGVILHEKTAYWLASWLFIDKEAMASFVGTTLFTRHQLRWLGTLLVIVLLFPNSNWLAARLRQGRLLAIASGVTLVLCVLSFNTVSEFLYYQF